MIGKVMSNLSAPGVDSIIAGILKPKDESQIPMDAGAHWPGRDWNPRAVEGEPPQRPPMSGPAAGSKANKKYEVDFSEMFAGCAILTGACSTVGLKVASALDILYQSYGRTWDFSRSEDQADAAYLIVYVFRPKTISTSAFSAPNSP